MFDAPFARLEGLSWTACGPGRDAAVLLQSHVVLDGLPFCLHAFRVPMPFSAGWSTHSEWEDDKGFQADGLLWDTPNFKSLVSEVDAMPDDSPDTVTFELVPPDADSATMELAESWLDLVDLLGWSGQHWQPSMIAGEPYIVLGHWNELPHSAASKHFDLPPAYSDPFMPKGERRYRLSIEGGTNTLRCADVRMLSTAGSRRVCVLAATCTPLHKLTERILAALPGSPTNEPFALDQRLAIGCIIPEDTATWSFDSHAFLSKAGKDMVPGVGRWWLNLPLQDISPGLGRLIEDMAERVRTQRLGRIGNGIYVTYLLDDILPYFTTATPYDTRASVGQSLGRLMVRAVGQSEDGEPWAFSGRCCERVYAIGQHVYVNMTLPLVHALAGLPPGHFLGVRANEVFSATCSDDVTSPPAWIGELPTIVDTPIRDLIRSLASNALD